VVRPIEVFSFFGVKFVNIFFFANTASLSESNMEFALIPDNKPRSDNNKLGPMKKALNLGDFNPKFKLFLLLVVLNLVSIAIVPFPIAIIVLKTIIAWVLRLNVFLHRFVVVLLLFIAGFKQTYHSVCTL